MADSNATVLESQLEYLSLSKPKKVLYRFTHFFTNMPKRFKAKARSMKIKARKSKKGFLGVFAHLFDAIRNGDYKTRLSFLIMGFGLFTRRQAIRGIFYFLFEISLYISRYCFALRFQEKSDSIADFLIALKTYLSV